LGSYKRVEKIMTFLLVAKLVCFIIVAAKGLFDWYTWPMLAKGLVPSIPADVPVVGGPRVRGGFTQMAAVARQAVPPIPAVCPVAGGLGVREGFAQMMAIAGQALPPTVFLAYGYLATNAGYT